MIDVDVWVRGRQDATTQKVRGVASDAGSWSDGDVKKLLEGMLLALPGAFLGALVAWVLFNGNVVDVAGLIFKLTVTPRLLMISIFWALTIGLIGASLPAMRAARLPVATALRAT